MFATIRKHTNHTQARIFGEPTVDPPCSEFGDPRQSRCFLLIELWAKSYIDAVRTKYFTLYILLQINVPHLECYKWPEQRPTQMKGETHRTVRKRWARMARAVWGTELSMGWTIVGFLRNRLHRGFMHTKNSNRAHITHTSSKYLSSATFHHAPDEKHQACYLQADVPRFCQKNSTGQDNHPGKLPSLLIHPMSPTNHGQENPRQHTLTPIIK